MLHTLSRGSGMTEDNELKPCKQCKMSWHYPRPLVYRPGPLPPELARVKPGTLDTVVVWQTFRGDTPTMGAPIFENIKFTHNEKIRHFKWNHRMTTHFEYDLNSGEIEYSIPQRTGPDKGYARLINLNTWLQTLAQTILIQALTVMDLTSNALFATSLFRESRWGIVPRWLVVSFILLWVATILCEFYWSYKAAVWQWVVKTHPMVGDLRKTIGKIDKVMMFLSLTLCMFFEIPAQIRDIVVLLHPWKSVQPFAAFKTEGQRAYTIGYPDQIMFRVEDKAGHMQIMIWRVASKAVVFCFKGVFAVLMGGGADSATLLTSTAVSVLSSSVAIFRFKQLFFDRRALYTILKTKLDEETDEKVLQQVKKLLALHFHEKTVEKDGKHHAEKLKNPIDYIRHTREDMRLPADMCSTCWRQKGAAAPPPAAASPSEKVRQLPKDIEDLSSPALIRVEVPSDTDDTGEAGGGAGGPPCLSAVVGPSFGFSAGEPPRLPVATASFDLETWAEPPTALGGASTKSSDRRLRAHKNSGHKYSCVYYDADELPADDIPIPRDVGLALFLASAEPGQLLARGSSISIETRKAHRDMLEIPVHKSNKIDDRGKPGIMKGFMFSSNPQKTADKPGFVGLPCGRLLLFCGPSLETPPRPAGTIVAVQMAGDVHDPGEVMSEVLRKLAEAAASPSLAFPILLHCKDKRDLEGTIAAVAEILVGLGITVAEVQDAVALLAPTADWPADRGPAGRGDLGSLRQTLLGEPKSRLGDELGWLAEDLGRLKALRGERKGAVASSVWHEIAAAGALVAKLSPAREAVADALLLRGQALADLGSTALAHEALYVGSELASSRPGRLGGPLSSLSTLFAKVMDEAGFDRGPCPRCLVTFHDSKRRVNTVHTSHTADDGRFYWDLVECPGRFVWIIYRAADGPSLACGDRPDPQRKDHRAALEALGFDEHVAVSAEDGRSSHQAIERALKRGKSCYVYSADGSPQSDEAIAGFICGVRNYTEVAESFHDLILTVLTRREQPHALRVPLITREWNCI